MAVEDGAKNNGCVVVTPAWHIDGEEALDRRTSLLRELRGYNSDLPRLLLLDALSLPLGSLLLFFEELRPFSAIEGSTRIRPLSTREAHGRVIEDVQRERQWKIISSVVQATKRTLLSGGCRAAERYCTRGQVPTFYPGFGHRADPPPWGTSLRSFQAQTVLSITAATSVRARGSGSRGAPRGACAAPPAPAPQTCSPPVRKSRRGGGGRWVRRQCHA